MTSIFDSFQWNIDKHLPVDQQSQQMWFTQQKISQSWFQRRCKLLSDETKNDVSYSKNVSEASSDDVDFVTRSRFLKRRSQGVLFKTSHNNIVRAPYVRQGVLCETSKNNFVRASFVRLHMITSSGSPSLDIVVRRSLVRLQMITSVEGNREYEHSFRPRTKGLLFSSICVNILLFSTQGVFCFQEHV